jgi:hypothetical protein
MFFVLILTGQPAIHRWTFGPQGAQRCPPNTLGRAVSQGYSTDYLGIGGFIFQILAMNLPGIGSSPQKSHKNRSDELIAG